VISLRSIRSHFSVPPKSALVFTVAAVALTACEKAPDGSMRFTGQPKIENRWQAPTKVTDFNKLYSQNCLGCHSNGPATVSASIALDNPTYLSILPEATLRDVIANGVNGSLMPGFSIKAGGPLTDAQIDILVKGLLAKKSATIDPALPVYAAPLGNVDAGRALFEASVYARRDGQPIPLEKSILNPAFLGTISDQYIRTLLIVGLPQLGYPDFRGVVPGRVLTTQDVSDLTAWIVSNRKNEYGQPISAPSVGNPAEPPAPNSSATQSVP
jgi:mono/diheme cytochrome c family protein